MSFYSKIEGSVTIFKNSYKQVRPFDHLSPTSSLKIKRSTWPIASFNHAAYNKHLISPFFQIIKKLRELFIYIIL